MIRFQPNWAKCIEAIDLLSREQDGITQYYVGKICYFADKEHLLDYGRPITGDRYVAMEHGPVPSNIRDLLKQDGGLADDVLTELYQRVSIEKRKNIQHVTSKRVDGFPNLSETDKEYLLAALRQYGKMSFADLKQLSHDEAWTAAWVEDGIANEMNPEHWLGALGEQRNSALAYLSDRRVRSV